jgi:hypothetical protein
MISLSDRQLATVAEAAKLVDYAKRETFLLRVGAMLEMRHTFSDSDVADVCGLASFGLAQQRVA